MVSVVAQHSAGREGLVDSALDGPATSVFLQTCALGAVFTRAVDAFLIDART